MGRDRTTGSVARLALHERRTPRPACQLEWRATDRRAFGHEGDVRSCWFNAVESAAGHLAGPARSLPVAAPAARTFMARPTSEGGHAPPGATRRPHARSRPSS